MIMHIKNVSKKIGRKEILNNIDFEIHEAEIVGVIGPNGSGKTTLLNLIMGLLKPSSGTILFKDFQVNAAVSRKGFFEDLSVEKNLMMYSILNEHNQHEVAHVLELFAIDFKDISFGKLSAGMKQRVALAKAFMGDCKLMLLDEPTNHLDIDSILMLRKAIEVKQKAGTAFLISSHILTELEKLCDRILFLKDGKILIEHTMEELNSQYPNLEAAYLKISQV
jgi:ABC-2 type transport system ATP-binding protein